MRAATIKRARISVSRTVVTALVLSLIVTVAPVSLLTNLLPQAHAATPDGLNAYYRNDTTGGDDKDIASAFTTLACTTEKITSTSKDWSTGAPSGCTSDNFTGYYTGWILGPKTGVVNFSGTADDVLIVRINGQSVVKRYYTSGSVSGSFTFTAGVAYPIQIWFHEVTGGAAWNLQWDTSGSAATIGSTYLASTAANLLDAQYQTSACQIGYSSQCPAYSPQEIYNLYGTTTDGNYWIMVGGTPSYEYVLMDRSFDSGGWILGMKATSGSSSFDYEDTYHWQSMSTENAYNLEDTTYTPARIASNGTGTDAKYDSFNQTYAQKIRAVFPQYAASTYGGRWTTNNNYGFMWEESLSSLQNGAANSTSYPTASYPLAASSACTGISTITLNNLFTNSSRCLFRTPSYSYTAGNSNTSSYDPIGNGLFASQNYFAWWGINYTQPVSGGSPSTYHHVRFGFGWNENNPNTDEGSNDVTAGIGLYNAASGSKRTGSHAACCSSQTGVNAQIGFEIYLRQADPSLAAPTNIRASYTSTTSANITWSAPAGVTPTEYVVQYKLNTSSWDSNVSTVRILDPGTSPSAAISGLSAGAAYNFRVFARTVDLTTKIYDTNSSSAAAYVRLGVEDSNTDYAFNFAGNQYMYSAQESPFDIATGTTYSIEAWVKTTTTSGIQMIAAKNGQYALYINGTSFGWNIYTTDVTAGVGGDSAYFGTDSVRANEWQHVAVTRSGTNCKYYLNGNLIYTATTTMAGSILGGSNPFVVGGLSASSQNFNGQIDQVRLWSSERSLADIRDGMHRYIPTTTTGLVAAYGFNEGSGSYAFDVNVVNPTGTDLNVTGGQNWTQVAQTTTSGPYSYVTFPRSILNLSGGWKVPDSITAVSTVVVAGGGGGNANSDNSGWMGGGGGAGGYQYFTTAVTPGRFETVTVGMGGRKGKFISSQDTNSQTPTNGQDSIFLNRTSVGGGYGGGMSSIGSGVGAAGGAGGSGGGGGTYSGAGGTQTTGQGNAGGTTSASCCASGGGGGAGGAGGTGTATGGNGTGGAAGNGVLNPLYISGTSAQYLAGGGAGGGLSGAGAAGTQGGVAWGAIATANTGSGGGGGGGNATTSSGAGYGGSGIVILRYITALKPTFTKPTIAYLNAGMTETFTTNVAQDSATAVLTRTFRWESSTNYDTGTYSLIKTGTGAANAFFSWVPQDTATSGNKYVYRVIVTDSDTAGLFIVDTSTAVYAIINGRLTLSAKSTLTKTINISKTETFTVSSGTPTYSYSLSPTSTNFWLDTSTVGSPRIKFSDTVTVGTYYETFTVTDSVTSSIVLPLTIVISPPPSFGANAALVDTGTVLYYDAGNTTSNPGTSTWIDLSGRNLSASGTYTFGTSVVAANGTTRTSTQYLGGTSCSNPSTSATELGTFTFNGSSTCAYAPTVGFYPQYTYQTWIKRNGAQTTDYTVILTNPYRYDYDQLNISLYFDSSTGITAGVFNGNVWAKTPTAFIPDGVWTHVTVTYSGSVIKLILNGDTANAKTNSSASVTWSLGTLDPTLIFGLRWGAATSNTWFKGSMGDFRLYNRVLTDAELTQNYNATKGRYLLTQNKQNQVGKYGTLVSDTYTVTAGSETITATFATPRAYLVWDTSTARSVRIKMQESLTAGTYYDTMTVTDIYGSSTQMAIKFVISKADTLTVYIDTPTALTYTGAPANFTPVVKVIGLVNADTGTTVSAVNYKPGGLTCATGGTCAIGDIGPGGGVVFITPSTVGGNGKYFEAAPSTWYGVDETTSNATYCSNSNLSMGGTGAGIGWGDTNTAIARTQCLGGAVAKVNSFNQSNNTGYSDWFIPSTNELTELVKVRSQAGLLRLSTAWSTGQWGYWGSSENNSTVMATLVTDNGQWAIGGTNKNDSVHNIVRPVRQFTPCWAVDSCTALSSTTKPSQAGGYAITPAGFSLSVGSLNNYETVTYMNTFVTINRAAQSAQAIPYYSPSYPETMTVYTGGGSGTGAQSFTVLAGGTANSCAFDFRKLTTNGVGTCNIQVVKQGDRNYLPDTATAYIYILAFAFNQPSSAVGSGPGIALGGINTVTLDSTTAPTITAVTWVTNHWEISGAGFGALGNSNTVVKFWRNKPVIWDGGLNTTNYVASDTLIYITNVPVGATTGKIMVITANGIAVSTDNWIAP